MAAELTLDSCPCSASVVRVCRNADGLTRFQDVKTTVQTLQLLGLAAAAVTASGKVIVANVSFKGEGGPWTTRSDNTVALLDLAANERLQQVLATISERSSVHSIPLHHHPGIVRHVLHVLPVRQQNSDGAENPFAILAITCASFKGGSLALLQSLFNLTPAEAALAQRIGMDNRLKRLPIPTVAAFTPCAASSKVFWPRQAVAARLNLPTFSRALCLRLIEASRGG